MVSIAERLAALAGALEEAQIPYLVMGGHAVRYYGVERTTADYDFHLSLDDWDRLGDRLQSTSVGTQGPLQEGPSWRPRVFRRFLVGRLPDGREEWLEFWRANHLLAPFTDLAERQERGTYGGRLLPFLGLSDLIRSKETERGSDWQDVTLLEEIRDARNLACAVDEPSFLAALAQLRSRTGFERLAQQGRLADGAVITAAIGKATDPVTSAYLLPFAPNAEVAFTGTIGEILDGPLRRVVAGSARHLALAEAIRRLYKQAAIDADRADKMRALAP
ncbi:MAG: hypothetical protein K2R98_34310 [Gemmataceae bacterium]|nr:hypothetical protein [Gemmataceae bacterium]